LTCQSQGQNKSLELRDNNKIELIDSGNYGGQFWKFTPIPDQDGWYKIASKSAMGKVLDVSNDVKGNTQFSMTYTGNYSGQN